MNEANLIEYRILSTSHHAAVVSLFAKGLCNTALIQLLRIETGLGRAMSVFAVYREGSMTFETSARLSVPEGDFSVEALLCELIADEGFLGPLLEAISVAVDKHFGRPSGRRTALR